MSVIDRAQTLMSRAMEKVDDCRDRLSYLEQSVDDLTRRRRPVERLDLDDIVDGIKSASAEADSAHLTLDAGLDELRVAQEPVATAVLTLSRELAALKSEIERRLPPPPPKAPRPPRRPS